MSKKNGNKGTSATVETQTVSDAMVKTEAPNTHVKSYEAVTSSIYLAADKLIALLTREAKAINTLSPLETLATLGLDNVHGKSLILSCFGRSQNADERGDFYRFSFGIMPSAKTDTAVKSQFALLHGINKSDLDAKGNEYSRGQVSRTIKRVASEVLAALKAGQAEN